MEEKKDFAEEIKTKTEEVKEDIKAKTEEANAKMEDQFEEGVNKSKEVAGKVGTNLSKTIDNTIIAVKEIQKNWVEYCQGYLCHSC